MKQSIRITLLSCTLVFSQFSIHLKTGLSTHRASVNGRVITVANEMDMYAAIFDAQTLKGPLDAVIITPQKSLYVRAPSQGQPWQNTTRGVYLIRANLSTGAGILSIDEPGLVTPSTTASPSANATYAQNALTVTYTNATVNTDQLSVYTVVNQDYTSLGDTPYNGGTNVAISNHIAAIIPYSIAEQVTTTVGRLVEHASEGDTHLHLPSAQTAYRALSASAQAEYAFEDISAVFKAYIDYPLLTTSDDDMSLIKYSPETSFGLATGLGLQHKKYAKIDLFAGIEFFQGTITSTLPRDTAGNLLPSMSTSYSGTTYDTTSECYPELSSEELSDHHYFVELNLSKQYLGQNMSASASIRHAFNRTPDETNFSKFTLSQTSLNFSIDYKL